MKRKVFIEHHKSPEVQEAIAEANALAPGVEDLVACPPDERLATERFPLSLAVAIVIYGVLVVASVGIGVAKVLTE